MARRSDKSELRNRLRSVAGGEHAVPEALARIEADAEEVVAEAAATLAAGRRLELEAEALRSAMYGPHGEGRDPSLGVSV